MTGPVRPVTQARACAREGCTHRYEPTERQAGVPIRYCSRECFFADKPLPVPRPRAQLTARPGKKRARPTSPASPGQRAKRNGQVSIVSRSTTGLDAAHLTARAQGGCDDPLCVVSLTRAEHRALDEGRLDVLPYLLRAGCVDELCHALAHYHGNLPALLHRLTGTRWQPVPPPIPGGHS